MATRRSPKGSLARERIVVAAERLFGLHGFHGASVRDIARAASMPTASLLHHFPSKERVYGAVLGGIAADIDRAMERALAGTGGFTFRLRRMCQALLDWIADNPSRSNLLVRELLDNQARVGKAHQLPLKPVIERMRDFIAAGRRAGAFAPIDPFLLVVHFAGAASYFCAARPTLERITSARRLEVAHRRQLTALVERALLPRRTG